jgi:hypothetical protein
VKRLPLWKLLVPVALVLGAWSPDPAAAQDSVPENQISGDAFDPVGDTPYAPDVGKINASTLVNGAYRKVVVGTWLGSSDLVSGDLAAWQIDTIAGAGQPNFGGEYLVNVTGHDGTSDTWSTYAWGDGAWAPQALRNFRHWTEPDGRIYWELDFSTTSTSSAPVIIGIRAITQYTASDGYWWRDYAPNDHSLGVSLEPHGVANPLEGCTYDGGCVGGASGVGAYGPGENSGGGSSTAGSGGSQQATGSACADAKRALRKGSAQLRSAKAAKRRARSAAVRRRRARAVRRLTQRRARLARAVAEQC